MHSRPIARTKSARKETGVAALARASAEAYEAVVGALKADNAELRAQALGYQTAIDAVPVGVCFFDRDSRLVLCNRRYSEIYNLGAETIPSGTPLREILERRFAAGTCAAGTVEDYLDFCAPIAAGGEAKDWDFPLPDGRTVRIHRRPTPDGGWVAIHDDVTEIQASRTLAAERISLQTLIDLVPDNLWVKDAESRFVVANVATAARLGKTRQELIGKTDLELCPPETAQKYFADERKIVATGRPMIDGEEYILGADGAKTWIATTKVPMRDDAGEIVGLIGVSRDISARRKADALRDGQTEILEMIAMSAPLGGVLDRLVRLIESQLTGMRGSVVLLDADGRSLRLGAAPNLPPAYLKAIDGLKVGPKAGSSGTALYRREPVVVVDVTTDPLWEDLRGLARTHGLRSCWSFPVMSHRGEVLGVFALYSRTARQPTEEEERLVAFANRIASIAIERKLAEDRIQYMATHDTLTGLPNRALLKDRLNQALLFAKRYERWATLAFVDLDNFKVINDSLGHNAGDELLKKVAAKMVACVRATDTVVRIGGDEFIVLLFDQTKNVEAVSVVAQKIQAAIAEPIEIAGHTLRVTSSVGIANYPDDAENPDALLANADAAMYRAKELGRDNFQFYTRELNVKIHDKFLMQEELRVAAARGQLILLYQPQVDLHTDRIFAVEALLRWRHPVHGLLSPLRFIPLAEETGLIVPIGEWVIHEACRQNKAWQDAGLPPMGVCVNVSARQFKDKRLVQVVAAALKASGLAPRYLELELTESLIMQDVDQAVATMGELQALGVQLSIDDFGTGYSSLSALKTFPVARLKIDKSLICGLPTDEHDKAVATAVISLGRQLHMRVIAEGVETEAQLAFLREYHCDEIQGYHFSKPVPPQELETLVRSRSKVAERG